MKDVTTTGMNDITEAILQMDVTGAEVVSAVSLKDIF
jgi:hypothetical protein